MVVRGGYYGRYVPSGLGSPKRDEREGGHLIYLHQGTVFAVPFDLTRLETVGPAAPALEGVAAFPNTGGAKLAVSSEGTLVYVPGTAVSGARPIDWLTRDGKAAVLRATNALWSNPRFSPNGEKLALDISDGKQRDIWVYDWARDTLTQLTFDPGEDRFPVWTPDGRRIVFASDRAKAGTFNLYWANADGTGEVTRLTDSPESQIARILLASERQIPRLPGRPCRHRRRPDDPAHGGGCHARMDARHAHGISELAGQRSDADVLAGRPLDRVHLERVRRRRRYLRAPIPRPRRPVAHLHGRRSLSAVVGHGARAAVRSSKPRSWPHGTPSSATPSAPTRRRSGRRRAFRLWLPGTAGTTLHPDGKRVAAAAVADDSEGVVNDKVVFVFNFGEYLRTIAPGTK